MTMEYRMLNDGEVRVTRMESGRSMLSVELQDDSPYSRTNLRITLYIPQEQQARYAVGSIHVFALTPVEAAAE